MNSGTFESETHTDKQPDFINNTIYEYHKRLLGNIPIKAILTLPVMGGGLTHPPLPAFAKFLQIPL